MAKHCRALAEGNPHLRDVVVVVQGKVEEAELPEPADVLVSEPMGTLLFNERMIETYLIARDRFLRKPDTTTDARRAKKRRTHGRSPPGSDRRASDSSDNLKSRMFGRGATVPAAPFVDATLHGREGRARRPSGARKTSTASISPPIAAAAERSYFRQCVVDTGGPSRSTASPPRGRELRHRRAEPVGDDGISAGLRRRDGGETGKREKTGTERWRRAERRRRAERWRSGRRFRGDSRHNRRGSTCCRRDSRDALGSPPRRDFPPRTGFRCDSRSNSR